MPFCIDTPHTQITRAGFEGKFSHLSYFHNVLLSRLLAEGQHTMYKTHTKRNKTFFNSRPHCIMFIVVISYF